MNSENEVTVAAALEKGKKMVGRPLMYLFFFLMVVNFSLFFVHGLPAWTYPTSLLLVFVLSFLFYFILVPRWRIWAFSNVRNVHQLSELAELAGITPPLGSFPERLEIMTKDQRNQLSALRYKFDQPDIFIDDLSLPYETIFYFPKSDKIIAIVFTVGSCIGAIILLIIGSTVGLILIPCALIFAWLYSRIATSEPILILNGEGINTRGFGFVPWTEVSNDKIFKRGSGKNMKYMFSYEANGERIEISASDILGKKSYMIHYMLRIYRGRNEQTHRTRTRNFN